jgi:hypothetical protein
MALLRKDSDFCHRIDPFDATVEETDVPAVERSEPA